MENGEDEITELPYEEAESMLYLCDCANDSARVDPSFHAYNCGYRMTYNRRLTQLNANRGKEHKE